MKCNLYTLWFKLVYILTFASQFSHLDIFDLDILQPCLDVLRKGGQIWRQNHAGASLSWWRWILLCCFWMTRLCDWVDEGWSRSERTHKHTQQIWWVQFNKNTLCHVPCAVCQDILEDVLGGGYGMGHACKGNWDWSRQPSFKRFKRSCILTS